MIKTVDQLIEELKKLPGDTTISYSVSFEYKYPFLRAQGDFTEVMYLKNQGELIFLGDGGTNEDYTEMD
jgi:hypothetical protein